jgi:DNA-binding NarL/FixJ family response regulator
MSIRILIADDHKLVRDGLRAMLAGQPRFAVVGEAKDGPTAVALAAELKPDIILMDISMPELNGIEATRQILAGRSSTGVIILSMHSDRRFVTESLRTGARGYLLKDSAFEELVAAIDTVAKGKIYLSRTINDIVVDDYVNLARNGERSAFTLLSAREREVLQLLAEGKSTKETAARLHVSVKTIETHRKQIMDKLDTHSIAELTKYAIREGLTPLE